MQKWLILRYTIIAIVSSRLPRLGSLWVCIRQGLFIMFLKGTVSLNKSLVFTLKGLPKGFHLISKVC